MLFTLRDQSSNDQIVFVSIRAITSSRVPHAPALRRAWSSTGESIGSSQSNLPGTLWGLLIWSCPDARSKLLTGPHQLALGRFCGPAPTGPSRAAIQDLTARSGNDHGSASVIRTAT